ncbi:MAG: hypothetical protein ACP6IP_03370 [Candidatus Njordarchaeia archaeon]
MGNTKNLNLAPLENSFSQEAKKMKLDSKMVQFLEREGIIGFAFLDFNTVLGPVLKYYYYGNSSSFIKKLKDNPASVVELSIVGKYANEFVTPNNEKLLIKKIVKKDEYGRDIPNYVVIELKGRKKRLARSILERLAQSGGEATNLEKVIRKNLEFT